MIMRRISISLTVVFVCLALVVSVNAEPNFANVYTGNIKKRPLKFVPGQVLVKFKETVTDDEAEQIVRGLGTHIKRRALRRRAFNVVSVPQGQVWRKIQALSHNPKVEYAHPDWIVYAADFPYDPPNDPRYGPYQWNLHSSAEGGINMESAWAINMGGSQEVVVAVLDTGIAYEDYPANNPTYCRSRDFDGTSFAPGYDFINNDSHPNDDNGHGTHVTSTIAETTNNGWDFAGIAYKTTLMPVKILGKDGSGAISTIADGIYFAVDHGADIISMSFGTSAPKFFLTALENAVKYAHSNGVLLVAASGNAGADNPMYPAGYSEVIAVGATTKSGALASYTNRGNEICAPGGDYYDQVYQYDFTLDSDWYCVFSIQGAYGTSMATPHVAGVAALLLAEDPSLTNEDIRQILSNTADQTGVDACGSGFLNAFAALQSVATEDTPPTVEITSPANGSTVSGELTITANATDENGVEYVSFFVDGNPIVTDTDGLNGWSAAWYTTADDNGSHEITATATDSKGQTGNYSITVTVSNKNIHIGDLDGFSTRLKWDVVWQATVTITVQDHLHNPVQGANVKILWSDGSPDSCLQVTDGNGKCTAIGFTWKWKQWLGLTVTDVKSTLPYEPIGNHDPDGDSDGTEIWIRR
jgi:serine protease